MRKGMLTTILVLSACAVSAQDIGQVLDASGRVSAGGAPLKVGQSLLTDAHLVSGDNAFVKLRMRDDSLIVLNESSDFRVDRYQFGPASPEAPGARYVLESGAVRLVSGAMSRLHPGSVRLATPYGEVTTVGTDYSAGLCAAGCVVAPGLYLDVKSGRISIQGSKRATAVATGQTVRVNPDGSVDVLADAPGFMLALGSASFPALAPNDQIRVRLGVDTQEFLDGVNDPAASPSLPVANNSR